MKKSILSFLFLLFLLPDIGSSAEVSAQLQDSTVVVHGEQTLSRITIGYTDHDTTYKRRYYLSGCFEHENSEDWGFTDILYLGGDAMTAPVALRRFWDDSDESDPSGAEWEVLDVGRGFTGHIIIPEFFIYHCGARLYNSQTGRFLCYDPVVQDPDNTKHK